MEIERKWEIDGFPQGLPLLDTATMEQAYLSTRPVVRIRASHRAGQASYILCIKGEGGLAREEIELPVEEAVYRRIARLIGQPPIVKEYRAYRLPGGERLEVNLVDAGTPAAFYYAEVEFETVAQAQAFTPPPCLGRELTGRPGASMNEYWEQRAKARPTAPGGGGPL